MSSKHGMSITMMMIRMETRIERDWLRWPEMTFAVLVSSTFFMPGRKRRSFRSLVKRPALAPSLAMRAARMTTVLSRAPPECSMFTTMEWSSGTETTPMRSM